jgi:hypothetical protein
MRNVVAIKNDIVKKSLFEGLLVEIPSRGFKPDDATRHAQQLSGHGHVFDGS